MIFGENCSDAFLQVSGNSESILIRACSFGLSSTEKSALGFTLLISVFLRILHARAWEYCKYGPESPSKFNACSQEKLTSLAGAFFSIAYLIAPTTISAAFP